MEHGLKHITFYVQKHIAALVLCYNPGLDREEPSGAPASVKLMSKYIAFLWQEARNLLSSIREPRGQ